MRVLRAVQNFRLMQAPRGLAKKADYVAGHDWHEGELPDETVEYLLVHRLVEPVEVPDPQPEQVEDDGQAVTGQGGAEPTGGGELPSAGGDMPQAIVTVEGQGIPGTVEEFEPAPEPDPEPQPEPPSTRRRGR